MKTRGARILRSAVRLSRRILQRTIRFWPDDPRRTTPLYRGFGYHRGTPVDRYYIERFLAGHAEVTRGDGLQVAEDGYVSWFGAGRLRSATTFHLANRAPRRVVGDITQPDALPEGVFNCFICTQTLNFVPDVHSSMRGWRRLLKPGGHLLLTGAGTSQVSRYDADRWGDYWQFSQQGLARQEVLCPILNS